MKFIEYINAIKEKLIEILNEADIQNLQGKTLKIVDTGLTSDLDKTDCPIVAVYKTETGGNFIPIDQPLVELPRSVTINLAIADYSMVSVNEAENLTDDLIDKILEVLSGNTTLDGLTNKIRVDVIHFDEMRIQGVFYSIPEISLTISLKEI